MWMKCVKFPSDNVNSKPSPAIKNILLKIF